MINNIEVIKPLLDFQNEGDFFMLYVLKRKKDQPETERDNHQSVRTIKSYCIESMEELEKKYEDIKFLCEHFRARAYIHINRQNHKSVGLTMLADLASKIRDGQTRFQHLFDSVVGQVKFETKRWIIDIDTKDPNYLSEVKTYIDNCQPAGEKLITIIPTRSGCHLISKPFNVDEFRKQGFSDDIQKKNPTLLYLPNSLL